MNPLQLNILGAIEKRDAGISLAEDHADAVSAGWAARAYQILLEFIKEYHNPFMVEELRAYAAVVDFEAPPSNRAWGAVILRAVKNGLVVSAGYNLTSNPKSHRTPARLWRVK